MTCHQAIVWIDDAEAWILRMAEDVQHVSTILAKSIEDLREGLSADDCGIEESDVFFHQVARALDVADEILVVGPSAIKVQLVKYMHNDAHSIDPRILGVETIDLPSSIRLTDVAKLYFTIGHPLRSSTENPRESMQVIRPGAALTTAGFDSPRTRTASLASVRRCLARK